MPRARLILADGTWFEGEAFGASGLRTGEVVFYTGMTGFQEVLTDPATCNLILLQTYPLAGVSGINADDSESCRLQVAGLVTREVCNVPSNWRATKCLPEFFSEHGSVGLSGIDTRMLTRHLRTHGTMGGVVTTGDESLEALVALARQPQTVHPVSQVSTQAPYRCPGDSYRVVVLDCGLKLGTLRALMAFGCDITVVPATTPADDILTYRPHGVLLSSGPGDPKGIPDTVQTIRTLLGQVPVFGIGLGHQLMALACGADTQKMKFGHRGTGHPVRDLLRRSVIMTSQNHGYVVAAQSLPGTGLTVTHLSLQDGTIEGLEHQDIPAFSLQFHPQGRPGPNSSREAFGRFMTMMANWVARRDLPVPLPQPGRPPLAQPVSSTRSLQEPLQSTLETQSGLLGGDR